jgi:hypothetical protein
MPNDFRRNVAVPIHSGPDRGVGTYMCADKYPADYDFSIVEKVLEARANGKIDEEFFRRKDKARSHQPALTQGGTPWVEMALTEARIARMYTTADWIDKQGGMLPPDVRQKALAGPFPSYFEEHCANVDTPEFETFQDEWIPDAFSRRVWRMMDTFMCKIPGDQSTRATNTGVVITPAIVTSPCGTPTSGSAAA